MDEKKIENTLRNFVDSLEKNDIERALSLFSDDARMACCGGYI